LKGRSTDGRRPEGRGRAAAGRRRMGIHARVPCVGHSWPRLPDDPQRPAAASDVYWRIIRGGTALAHAAADGPVSLWDSLRTLRRDSQTCSQTC